MALPGAPYPLRPPWGEVKGGEHGWCVKNLALQPAAPSKDKPRGRRRASERRSVNVQRPALLNRRRRRPDDLSSFEVAAEPTCGAAEQRPAGNVAAAK